MSFDDQVVNAVQTAIVDFLKKGQWLTINWQSKLPVDVAMLRTMRDAIDMNRVVELCNKKLEELLAEKIINSMISEVTTDVKQIMSNNELREDLRAILRSKIREHVAATHTNPELEAEKDVHTEHCCAQHGCKYHDIDCPVWLGYKKQSFAYLDDDEPIPNISQEEFLIRRAEAKQASKKN